MNRLWKRGMNTFAPASQTLPCSPRRDENARHFLGRANKGTTLVEILVVMVVLLVGIMIVITMFPTGFRVVRAAESQTIATKLAQAEVERWKNMAGNLPDGILPIAYSAGGSPSVINDQDPGPGFDGMLPTATTSQYYPGNAGNFRLVQNETTTIPAGSYFQTGGGALYGSRYNLAFAPIEVEDDLDNKGQYLGLSVKSGDLQRRVGDHDDPIYLRIGQYGVDYTLGTTTDGTNLPCFYVCFSYDHNNSHIYHVNYSYSVRNSTTGDTQYLSTVDQEVHPMDPSNPEYKDGWVEVPVDVPAGYLISDDEIDGGSVSCARGFAQVVNNWSDDPYEFTLADPILGIVAFNPRAHNALERTARGVRAVTARITYRIYDTRIIREERVVPALNEDMGGSGTNDHTQIKLALRFILDSGDPNDINDGDATDNPDEPTYEGLVRQQLGLKVTQAIDIKVPQAMLVIDLATGLRVEMPGGSIDFKNGIVHLPKTANLIDWTSHVPIDPNTKQPYPEDENVVLKGRHLKFFYRADGDWSVQCQKAYSYYIRKFGAIPPNYQEFKLVQDGNLWKLLFARCMSGQSVSVDYTYTDAGGVVRKVSGKSFRLSDEVISDGGTKCCYVTLGSSDGTVNPVATINPNDRIIVVGTSFRSRVIWRDGKAWRYVDIDTNLTRNSAQ